MMPDTDSLARVQQFLRDLQTYQERLRATPLPDRADPEEILRYLRELRQPTTPNLGQATLEAAGRDLAELARLQRAFSVGEGLVMDAGPHGIHIAATATAANPPPAYGGGSDGFWAGLTANSYDPVNWTWTYSWEELEKTAIAYGGWTTKSGGMFGTYAVASGGETTEEGFDRGPAYNTIENMNADSGLVGAGVDVDGLDTDYFTFVLKEIPIGAIVWMRPVPCVVDEVEVTEYWFSAWNAVDGACD